jgi:hypothetical protein
MFQGVIMKFLRDVTVIGMFTLMILGMMNPIRAEVEYNVDEDQVLIDVLLEISGNIKEDLNVTVLSMEEADPGDFNELLNDPETEFKLTDYDPELTWDDVPVVQNTSYVFYAYQGEKGNLSEGIQVMGDNYYWYYFVSYESVNEYYASYAYTLMLEEIIFVLIIAMALVSAALLVFAAGNRTKEIKIEVR